MKKFWLIVIAAAAILGYTLLEVKWSHAGGFDLSVRAPQVVEGASFKDGNTHARVAVNVPILDFARQAGTTAPLATFNLGGGLGFGDAGDPGQKDRTYHGQATVSFRDIIHMGYLYDFTLDNGMPVLFLNANGALGAVFGE